MSSGARETRTTPWVQELLRRFYAMHPLTSAGYGRATLFKIQEFVNSLTRIGVVMTAEAMVHQFVRRSSRRRGRTLPTSRSGELSRERGNARPRSSIRGKERVVRSIGSDGRLHLYYRVLGVGEEAEEAWVRDDADGYYNVTDDINFHGSVTSRLPLPHHFATEAEFDAMVAGYTGPGVHPVPEDEGDLDRTPSDQLQPYQVRAIQSFARRMPLTQFTPFYGYTALVIGSLESWMANVPNKVFMKRAWIIANRFKAVHRADVRRARAKRCEEWLRNRQVLMAWLRKGKRVAEAKSFSDFLAERRRLRDREY
ncbi:hypothetical protein QR680_009930 [Steinernema hermaphroditum]|uniref:Uncharacterized protein n=1 Tax=Steinernema hermaphroditum TaxID=289476 RepID=A0AA39IM44_9BILA|nr:hypothetical protein QR680_009930 [Steinernema hermaphroditum]